jgi:hypothetical protein
MTKILIFTLVGIYLWSKIDEYKTRKKLHKNYLQAYLKIEKEAVAEVIDAIKFFKTYPNYKEELNRFSAKSTNLAFLTTKLVDAMEDLRDLNYIYLKYKDDWKIQLKDEFRNRFHKVCNYLQNITGEDLNKLQEKEYEKRRSRKYDILEKFYDNGNEPYYVPDSFFR